MKVNKENANKIWKAYFGSEQCVGDAFGRKICKSNHGDDGANSWEVDHIWPQNPDNDNAPDGANTYSNVQPLHSKSNDEKSNKLQGKCNDITFAVVKIDNNGGDAIGRMKVKHGDEWYWAYNVPDYD